MRRRFRHPHLRLPGNLIHVFHHRAPVQGLRVKRESDLAGKVLAVQLDTRAHQWVKEVEARKVAIKNVLLFPGSADPFDALRNGQADITFAHEPVARYYVRQTPALEIMGAMGHALDPDPVAIAFCKQDKELQAAAAKAIQEMRQDGAFARLLEKWFRE